MKLPSASRLVSLLLFASCAAAPAVDRADRGSPTVEAWSRFRGPNGAGVADGHPLPDRLDPERTLVWRTPLAAGHSSPVLSDERVFVTALDGEELVTLALARADGRVLWRRVAPRPRAERLDGRNHPASPSPVVDPERVVVFFPDYGLLAYDHDGDELWRTPLGPFDNLYGMGASPIRYADTVLLVCDQQTGSFLASFDVATGAERWRVARPEAKSSHVTPILHEAEDGVTELLVAGSFFLDAYDAATGEKRWFASGLSFEMKSVPVVADGLVFINGYGSPMNQPGNQVEVDPFDEVVAAQDADGDGRLSQGEMPPTRAASWFDFVDLDADGTLDATDWDYLARALASQNGMLAFELGGRGDVTDTALRWAYRRAVPQLPSPLVYRDVLHMLNDSGGLLTTFRPATGEVLEKGRVDAAVDGYYASPVAGDGKVYLVSEHGLASVLPADGGLEPRSVVDLGANVYATPALAGGRVYLRTVDALLCFGE